MLGQRLGVVGGFGSVEFGEGRLSSSIEFGEGWFGLYLFKSILLVSVIKSSLV
ncbi:MAG: hypothetical protein LBQ66_02630 [Planctomycetaceae bacterium]|jgi:hypothetical protein|nr:hypothetical protein [Planctomycetaceae bacterium]